MPPRRAASPLAWPVPSPAPPYPGRIFGARGPQSAESNDLIISYLLSLYDILAQDAIACRLAIRDTFDLPCLERPPTPESDEETDTPRETIMAHVSAIDYLQTVHASYITPFKQYFHIPIEEKEEWEDYRSLQEKLAAIEKKKKLSKEKKEEESVNEAVEHVEIVWRRWERDMRAILEAVGKKEGSKVYEFKLRYVELVKSFWEWAHEIQTGGQAEQVGAAEAEKDDGEEKEPLEGT